ncbi:MAG: MFS transporter, partial [Pseudomonadota bacterium]
MVIPARDSALASALAPVLALRRLPPPGSARNVALYPWFRLFKSLSFYQAVWFLYFQDTLSAAEAILLYAVYDVATTALEVPSGWMSDRLGRRLTLIASAVAGMAGAAVLAAGASFEAFVLGQVLMGASMAFASGTDSAFLYESLAAEGRGGDTEREEVRAWRFSFSALAVSAALGGALAMGAPALPYAVTALALGGALAIGLAFREPARGEAGCVPRTLRTSSLVAAFRQPVLAWLFVLGLVMYAFSHVPFVFGQPFILEALAGTALEGRETLASGAVTAVMMVVSVL